MFVYLSMCNKLKYSEGKQLTQNGAPVKVEGGWWLNYFLNIWTTKPPKLFCLTFYDKLFFNAEAEHLSFFFFL